MKIQLFQPLFRYIAHCAGNPFVAANANEFMHRLLTVSCVALQMRLRSTGPRAQMYTILVGLVSMPNSPGQRQTERYI